MVMHARKTQRMNDGYFEKHQAHPYQSSKYSSSKSYGSSNDRYERIRDSPNGNYRSDSPESQSPRERDRSYQSKSSYLQKIREKERENRDYKMSRDKYSDCARSPKDKRSRETEHRNDEKGILHPMKSSQLSSRDRKPMHNNCVDKRDDRDRVVRVGDWSEHVSSSGKKYYYNCKTEVSQWEKPREWLERERDRFKGRDRDRDSERSYSSSSSRSGTRHDKHSNSRGGNSSTSSNKEHIRESATSSRHWSSGSSRDDSDVPSSKESRLSRKQSEENMIQTTQDMDISPGDSTPTSEVSYGGNNSSSQVPTNEQNTTMGPVLLANALPRLISHPIHVPSTPVVRTEASPQNTPTIMTVASSTVTTSNAPGPPITSNMATLGATLPRIMSQPSTTMITTPSDNVPDKNNLHGSQRVGDSSVHTTLSVDTNHSGPVIEGPPTPTHSETADCAKVVAVPVSSPPGSLTSLQGVSSSLQALRPQGPTITPSLANHYRDDLVNHVRGWPAEIIEKQANKLADEAHIMGSIQCSKVSAELKSARSIVRLTEIQATLQEQRILFLRQQIKELEELKSQNSFMSDDT